MRILFVSANPSWTPRLDLLDELRELNASLNGKHYELELLPAAQPEDLIEAVERSDTPIDILHFSGHATEKHGLFFRSSDREKKMLTYKDINKIFKDKPVKLAVLNACHSRATAEGLKATMEDFGSTTEGLEAIEEGLQGVANTVIGTTSKLNDEAAKKMTKVLYAALANDKSIDDAIKTAKEVIAKSGFEDVYEGGRAEGQQEPELHFYSGDVEIDPENEEKWDRYFFERYLEEQIDSLTNNVRLNQRVLFGLLGLALVMIAFSWGDSIALRMTPDTRSNVLGSALSVLGYMGSDISDTVVGIANMLLGRAVDSLSETPLLDWLKKMGEGIPVLIASLQRRWCVHGNEKIRQLKALKELVENSESLSDTLRIRLHKILDQSVYAANYPPISDEESHESEEGQMAGQIAGGGGT